jgi:hypothetical protein
MSYSNQFNENLMDILDKLISNQNLCKLLYYDSSDPLKENDIADTKILLKKNIIPKPFMQIANTQSVSFLTVYFDNFRFRNNDYQDGSIVCNVVCHETLWEIKGGLRPYSVISELENMFSNQKVLGIGKTQLDSIKQVWINDNYKGYQVIFRFTDFS